MRPFNLSFRITLIVSLVMILVISISSVYLYNHLTELTKDHLIEETEINIISVSKDIENIFENATLATEHLSLQQHVRTYLKEVEERSDIKSHTSYDQVINTLVKVKLMNSYHYYTWIGNEKANFYIDHNGFFTDDTYSVVDRPWFDKAMDAENISISDPYVEVSSFNTVISFIKILYDDDVAYGFVAVDIVLEDIPSIIERMKISDEDQIYLVTQTGEIISTSSNIVSQNKNIFSYDWFDENRDHIMSADGKYKVVNKEDSNFLMSSHVLDTTGWIIITLTDYEVIENDLSSITLPIIIVFVVGLLVAIIFVYLFTHLTVSPFNSLVQYGKAIASGQYEKNVPKMYRVRKDEMGSLSNAFQSIIDTFRNLNKTLEEDIERKNQELEARYKVLVEQEKQASLGLMLSGVASTLDKPIKKQMDYTEALKTSLKEIEDKYSEGKIKKKDLLRYLDANKLLVEKLTEQLKSSVKIINAFKLISVSSNVEEKNLINLKEVLDTVGLSYKMDLDEGHHKYSVTCAEDFVINSYLTSLIQVMSQLIQNSLQHGMKNKPGYINVRVEGLGEVINIIYSDTGVGLSEDQVGDFENQYKNTGQSINGFGMQIVLNTIIHKMNGDISFVGKINDGVKYQIRLPK